MIRFLHPELLWLLALLPLLALWRGRKGQTAAVQYSNVETVRQISRSTRARPGRRLMLLRLVVGGLLILALRRVGGLGADVSQVAALPLGSWVSWHRLSGAKLGGRVF